MSLRIEAFLRSDSEAGEDDGHTFVIDRETLTLVSNLRLEAFRHKLSVEIFPSLRGKVFSLRWADDDGDYRELENDEELNKAFDKYSGETLKVYINVAESDAEPAGVLHDVVICDDCRGPIQGRRYACLQCPDYDLCERCRIQNIHREHAFACFFIPLPLRYTIRHPFVTCDVCARPVHGARYKCIDCPNYDLCVKCKREGQHARHEFCCIALPLPKEYQINHPGFTCCSCEVAICGIRYECQQCAAYNLCEHCRTARTHSQHRFTCIPFPPRDEELEFNIHVY